MMMGQMLVRMREEELLHAAERGRLVREARRAARADRQARAARVAGQARVAGAAARPGFRAARRLALVIGRR